MKRNVISLLLTATLCSLGACSNRQPDTGNSPEVSAGNPHGVYQKISAEKAKALMEESDSFVLLDVRTEQEFSAQRIEGAILIPDNELKARAESELADKSATIFVYCRTGRRSAAAAQILADLGYTNVYDFGGILDWPYETTT